MIFVEAYQVVVEAMKQHGIRRIFEMGTLSIPDAKDGSSFARAAMVWAVWLLVNRAYRNIVAIGNYFDTVSKDQIDWTVFRLGLVTDGEAPVNYPWSREGVHAY